LYRKKDNHQIIDDFILPFDVALRANNRWVINALLIPWDDIEGDYADLFRSGTCNVAKPARMALGVCER
jgi:IS5 family transposase